MVILIVLILGCFLEGNAIFIITIPIFLPIAQKFGIDLVNFGVVMTLVDHDRESDPSCGDVSVCRIQFQQGEYRDACPKRSGPI